MRFVKPVLAWLVLIVCYFAFLLLLDLDMVLLSYIFDLYDSLSPFLKLLIIIFGGSFITGLALLPLYYGIPFIHNASEAICKSEKGLRYTAFGILVCIITGLSILYGFMLRDIFTAILGIAFVSIGRSTHKEYTTIRKNEICNLETWYTCPRCGSFVSFNHDCDCGFKRPQSRELHAQQQGISFENHSSVSELNHLLSRGYVKNPYTGEPMCCIDDLIPYFERYNQDYHKFQK